MTDTEEPTRIKGPLKTWYDLHEALDHEATGIAADAARLTLSGLDAFATRFWAFDRELRQRAARAPSLVVSIPPSPVVMILLA